MTSIIDKLPKNWESKLEYELLLEQRNMYTKRAYICSPCSNDSKKTVYRNMRAARFYMYCVKNELGFIARAQHAYLPALLNDMMPLERAQALRIGLQLLESNDFVLVCGDRITSGMHGEIKHAAKLGIPIMVFHSETYINVRKIVTRAGADKGLISFESKYPQLSMNAEDLFSNERETANG